MTEGGFRPELVRTQNATRRLLERAGPLVFTDRHKIAILGAALGENRESTAARLGLKPGTVQHYRDEGIKALGADSSMHDAIIIAIQRGLISPEEVLEGVDLEKIEALNPTEKEYMKELTQGDKSVGKTAGRIYISESHLTHLPTKISRKLGLPPKKGKIKYRLVAIAMAVKILKERSQPSQ